ncbi:hypothetical protein CISG_04505 [Coccidioides immitis RMSCC 3703]|uniref:Serine hydrolase domain-containing protein n=1 Tax=Coccidioides immitis RMSCC 3703 TaxID=454286 RepID=A0A0J8QPI3_COCIT|nr:hypothetical protein CISG_04505 [Coccidioides immitis RMSCC 3703]
MPCGLAHARALLPIVFYVEQPVTDWFVGAPELGDIMGEEHVLKLPTIHVHGLADPGLHLHRELLENYCSVDSARVVEWNGAHRVPLKSADVNPLIEEILDLAKEIGAL